MGVTHFLRSLLDLAHNRLPQLITYDQLMKTNPIYICGNHLIGHIIKDWHCSESKNKQEKQKKGIRTHFSQVCNREHRIQNLSLLPVLFSYNGTMNNCE